VEVVEVEEAMGEEAVEEVGVVDEALTTKLNTEMEEIEKGIIRMVDTISPRRVVLKLTLTLTPQGGVGEHQTR